MKRLPESLIVALALVLVVGLHALVYGRYLPCADGSIGHDYAYYFPDLLSGAYWFQQNGAFSIPWFTPAFGGGLPFYAHPSCGYITFPQVAAIAAGPIFAVRATLVVFAALGFLGTYLCLRKTFALSLAAALLGATIFAWNGFFTARMLSGHLFFHSQMLVPLAAWWITRPVGEGQGVRRLVFDALCAGLAFAYMFQAGNFYGLVPAGLACAGIALVAALRGGDAVHAGLRFGGAIACALLLCLAKLSAGIAFLDSFPRAGYPLPGTSNPLGAIALVIQSVFVFPSYDLGRYLLVNERWRLDHHEWDFSLTWVTLILLVAGALALRRNLRERLRGRRNVALFAGLVVILLVPVVVNTYSPAWTAFLKSVPIVRNSSSLVRWFAAYVPIFTVLAALALDRIAVDPQKRSRLALAAAMLVLATHVLRDRSFYATQSYFATRIETAFDALRETGRVVPIERCSIEFGPDGRMLRPPDRNDGLVEGVSPIACFEPIFGYELEWFPIGKLHAGPARAVADGEYNFKNPASYLFPRENSVEPGGHFRVGQEAELTALLEYRPFPFAKSTRQQAAEIVNLIALLAACAFLLVCAVAGRMSRREV
ncbi:MAG: hypothetical protein JNL28_16065 [Planctomycetes bacterium]|nr:hypothetical protein [Planctomycetota bacterium]